MKKTWNIGIVYFVFITFMTAHTITSYFYNKQLFIISLIITTICAAFSAIKLIGLQKELSRVIKNVGNSLSSAGSKALQEMKIPVLICSKSNEIVWYNGAFEAVVPTAEDGIGKSIESAIGINALEQLNVSKQAEIILSDKMFAVFLTEISGDGQRIYYFFDQTHLKKIEHEHELGQPVFAILEIDNLDEITKNAKDSEIASFKGAIRTEIERWAAGSTGISRRLSNDKYLIITVEKHFKNMLEDRFSILEKVRNIKFGELVGATLSIGIGRGGKTLPDTEELANQALDMALGRGGDQAAIKNANNDFQFFGGVSGAIEKRTKVKVRVVSSALKELIIGSSRVVIMGHKYADLDSLGAAFALYSSVRALGKEAHIVMDKEKCMAKPLLARIEAVGAECIINDENSVNNYIDKDTLLIIVDVHRPGFLDSPELLTLCKKVVIIDHHRKAVDHIRNAVIFYNETAASSTCEIVAELLQYINLKSVTQIEAEALLSGIMLDTRNFVMNTGVRTFEASAFLRNRGADPITVKKLFSGSMPSYRQRANIVASAELYREVAVATNVIDDNNTKIATAQAADELLGIEGVFSSFVMCRQGDEINISARSLGKVNVQLIMEFLGGGGHRTMAACQLKTKDFEVAKTQLIEAIDNYYIDTKNELRG